MKSLLVTLVSLFAITALAESGTFEVKGMHCGGCKAMIEAKVCKMEGVEKCTVELTDTKKQIGKVSLITKDGIKIDTKKVEELISSAGEYKVTKAKIK